MFRTRSSSLLSVISLATLGAAVQVGGCAFQESEEGSPPPKPMQVESLGANSAGVVQLSTAGVGVGPGVAPVAGEVGPNGITAPTQQTGPNPGAADGMCGMNSQPAGVRPVVLLFAFDASASMGQKTSQPYYDPEKKWNPVVAASKAFFADTASAGLSATLTFFPQETPTAAVAPAPVMTAAPKPTTTAAAMGGAMASFPAQQMGGFQMGGLQMGGAPGGIGNIDPSMCQTMTYVAPDVPVTLLPSMAFATAMDAATPPPGANWRLGTPTQWALEGIQQQIAALKAAESPEHPNKYVVVLVTDGAPTDCTPTLLRDNAPVTKVLKAMSDAGSPTYVIGVNAVTGDPDGPKLKGNLDSFAAAGGTTTAFIVDTGDPAKTSADFKKVVDDIRNANKGCSIEIPKAPSGQAFDKEKVNVSYRDMAMMKTDLFYDKDCKAAGSWKFDNEAAPKAIELCPQTCGIVQQTVEAKLDLSLGCKRLTAPST